MAKVKGLGTIISVDPANGTSFTQLALTVVLTPPGIEVEEIDGTLLDSTLEDMAPGIDKATEFSFEEYYDPGSGSDSVLTLAASNATAKWKITYPDTHTDTFSGYIKTLSPAQATKSEYLKRTVTVRRTTAITRA